MMTTATEKARARLAEVLAQQFPALESTDRPPSLDVLVHLPATDVLQANLVKAQDALAAPESAGWGADRTRQAERRAQQEVGWGQVRDALQQGRPSDCWCL